MFHIPRVAALTAAILLGMASISAAAGAAGTAKGSFTGRAAVSQGFEGTITQIGAKAIMIDGVSFPYGWLVNPDIAPVPLEKFSIGEHVFFQVDKQGMIVAIAPMPSTAQPSRQRKFTPGRLEKSGQTNTPSPAAPPPGSGAANVPTKSAPIKQQNGVWTN